MTTAGGTRAGRQLQQIAAQIAGRTVVKNPVVHLYRTISKELPRVLSIYDADLTPEEARKSVQNLFRKNGGLKDPHVIDMLVKKGYMELEETLMQWKQKTHLMRLLAPEIELPRKYKRENKSVMAKFLANDYDE